LRFLSLLLPLLFTPFPSPCFGEVVAGRRQGHGRQAVQIGPFYSFFLFSFLFSLSSTFQAERMNRTANVMTPQSFLPSSLPFLFPFPPSLVTCPNALSSHREDWGRKLRNLKIPLPPPPPPPPPPFFPPFFFCSARSI